MLLLKVIHMGFLTVSVYGGMYVILTHIVPDAPHLHVVAGAAILAGVFWIVDLVYNIALSD